jgi:acetyl-CoA synthetase
MSEQINSDSLENLSYEDRTFAPSKDFALNANIKSDIYDFANSDCLTFWAKQADRLSWDKKWDQIVDWQLPFAKWFIGGKLNATYNCLDRHVASGLADRVAFFFEGEPGQKANQIKSLINSSNCESNSPIHCFKLLSHSNEA